jgi:hypothetical protein
MRWLTPKPLPDDAVADDWGDDRVGAASLMFGADQQNQLLDVAGS